MNLTKDQVNIILNNAPQGVDKTAVLDGLIQKGYQLEGVDTQAARKSIAQKMVEQRPQVTAKEATTRSVGQVISDVEPITPFVEAAYAGGQKVGKGIEQFVNAANPNTGAVEGMQDLAKGGLNIAGGTLETLFSPITGAVTAAGKAPGIKDAVEAINQYLVQPTADKLSDFPVLQKFAMENPNAEEVFGNLVNIVSTIALAPKVKTAIEAPLSKTQGALPEVVPPGGGGSSVKAPVAAVETPSLRTRAQNYLGEQNVEPRVKASAQRLGATKDPVASYNEFINQEKKYKSDIKQDTALGMVGERAGDAFDKVIKQRRSVGQTLGSELEKVGNTKTNIADSFSKFEQTLMDEGVTYDAKAGKVQAQGQVKIPAADQSLLSKYVKELNTLGAEPTIKDLDAFISRVESDLKLYKQKNNITGTTNSERIIKQNLSELRNQFNPEVTGNQALKPYYDARKKYSELSDFINEGEGYFGSRTQSGDFAKDASIVKSSVQSALNSGKKDFLIKLEELTGYPALDETVLALQAMKDSGNVQGRSLLEMFKNDVPTSTSGIRQKVIDYMLNKGAEMFAGSPDEQTRAFLQSLKKEAQRAGGSEASSAVRPPEPKITERKINKQSGKIRIGKPKQKAFSEFHPDDQRIFKESVDYFKEHQYFTEKNLNLLKDMWESYGGSVPKTPKGFFDHLDTVINSADQKAFDTEVNVKLGVEKPKQKTSAVGGQPRDDLGRFKKK